MKRAIIFDFDGTIADTFPAVIAVFEELTRQPQPLTAQQISHYRNYALPELIAAFKVPRWKVPYLFFRGRRRLKDHMDSVRLHKGVADVIKQLHAAGVPLYIVSSNSSENIRRYLQRHSLSDYFLAVYGGASPFAKAHKLLQLIDEEKLDVAGSWCIGDETRDVSAARAVGLHIVSVTWGYNSRQSLEAKQPDVLVDSADELLRVLKAAWKK